MPLSPTWNLQSSSVMGLAPAPVGTTLPASHLSSRDLPKSANLSNHIGAWRAGESRRLLKEHPHED